MTKYLQETENVRADVLVVGSGGAGLRAAIEARERGSDVLLVSHSRIGLGNNTAIAGRGVAAPNPRVYPEDSPEVYFRDIVIGGRFLNNQSLVEVMAGLATEEVQGLERFGVKLKRKEGEFYTEPVPANSYPRTHMVDGKTIGTSFTKPMTEYAQGHGVRFLPGVFISRVVAKDGRAAGAIGLDRSGKAYRFAAKSIVLANGGLGDMFLRNGNAGGITGDGYALAYDCGASLVDMEFVQYFPTARVENQGSQIVLYELWLIIGGAEIRNALGEDVLARHGIKDRRLMTRDRLSRAIMMEILEGRGVNGGVIMDFSVVPQEKYDQLIGSMPDHVVPKVKGQFVIAPTTHFHCGGVRIDGQCETGVAGLYAAGEVSGGMQGANRIAGNALTECYVMGRIAGEGASVCAHNSPDPDLALPEFDEELRRLDDLVPAGGSESLTSMNQDLKSTMWVNAGIVRTDASLLRAVQDISSIRERLSRANVANPPDLISFLKMDNMLTVSEILCRSALFRTESRGNHYRSDFPEEDNINWLKNVVVSKGAQASEIAVVPVDLKKLTPEDIN